MLNKKILWLTDWEGCRLLKQCCYYLRNLVTFLRVTNKAAIDGKRTLWFFKAYEMLFSKIFWRSSSCSFLEMPRVIMIHSLDQGGTTIDHYYSIFLNTLLEKNAEWSRRRCKSMWTLRDLRLEWRAKNSPLIHHTQYFCSHPTATYNFLNANFGSINQ